MGNCAEDTAKKYEVTREEQDEYARSSYTRSAKAAEEGILGREIVPVQVPAGRKGKPDLVVNQDEEFGKYVYAVLDILLPRPACVVPFRRGAASPLYSLESLDCTKAVSETFFGQCNWKASSFVDVVIFFPDSLQS